MSHHDLPHRHCTRRAHPGARRLITLAALAALAGHGAQAATYNGVGGAPTYRTRRSVATTIPNDSRHISVHRRCDANTEATIRSPLASCDCTSRCAEARATRRAPMGGTIAAAATRAATPISAVLLVRASTRRTSGRRWRISGAVAPARSHPTLRWGGLVAVGTLVSGIPQSSANLASPLPIRICSTILSRDGPLLPWPSRHHP